MDKSLSLLMVLAWPVVTLAIALIFRRDLTQALGRVGRFKYRDLEVTFNEDLHQAEALASKLPLTPAPVATSKLKDSIVLEINPGKEQPFVRQLSSFDNHVKARQSLLDLAGRSPRQAIESAWDQVGRTLVRGGRNRLTEIEARLVGLLQILRDRAARLDRDPPSAEEARRFVELACPLASRIESRS